MISKNICVGAVVDIYPDEVSFSFDNLDLTNHKLTVNSFIFSESNKKIFIFKVTDLLGSQKIGKAVFFVSVEDYKVRLLDTIDLSVGNKVYLLSNLDYVSRVFDLSEETQCRLECFEIANLNVLFKPSFESFFSKHFGVFGCTGSGKSWSVARLIEECQRYNPKIILVDPAGEYNGFRKCISLGFGKENCHPFTMPYHELLESDLFTIFQPPDGLTFMKLKSAIKTLKLAKLEPSIAVGGVVIKANREKKDFERRYQKRLKDIENEKCEFDISKLPVQIQNECVYPQQSSTEFNYWGGVNSSELSACAPFIGKVEAILKDPDLRFIFYPDKKLPSLVEVIDIFVEQDSKQILRISLAGFPSAFGVKETFVNILGRYLFNLSKKGKFLRKPLLFILDEAHYFLNEYALKFVKTFGLSSLEAIAKESRKFSLCLGLASQQVREITPLVISQLGCMLIHRLNDPADFELIRPIVGVGKNFSPEVVASLKTGEAILAGVDFERSILVRVLPPETRPSSYSARFKDTWIKSNPL